MALRHINPVNDNAIQLIADPMLSTDPWFELPDESSEPKPEQASNTAQSLAEEMELARKNLLNLIMEKHISVTILKEQLVLKAVEGVDYTMNTTDKSEANKPVQEFDIVQVCTEEKSFNMTQFNRQDQNLLQAHFFPVFLLNVAESANRQLKENFDSDFEYRNRLVSARLRLQKVRQQMITANTGLVAFVACKYKTQSLGFDDLVQEGSIGLIKAVDRFDASRGIRFSTYAIFWIKQAISRLIVKQEKVIRLPIALAERASIVFEIMRNSYLEHNRWPTLSELKAKCDLSMDDIKTISRYYQSTHSLDSAIGDQEDLTLMESLAQTQFAHPLDELVSNNLSAYINDIVNSLSEKEITILNMRFGLKNHNEMTLQAIADQLHVTRERVRQIQNDALRKLKQQFGCDLQPFLEPA